MGIETQAPTFEVIVRLEGSDVALIAAFPDGAGGYEVVVGTESSERLPLYLQLVSAASKVAGDITSWEDVSELRFNGPPWNETSAPKS